LASESEVLVVAEVEKEETVVQCLKYPGVPALPFTAFRSYQVHLKATAFVNVMSAP
jgi:hypothetical protein